MSTSAGWAGCLTNFVTIQKSIRRFKDIEEMASDGRYELLTKKEVITLERERKHLHQNLVGIKEMPGLPDVMFVIDSNKEQIAVREARKLGIPVVAVVDTNCDPSEVDYVIPGNDDALRAIRLFASRIADAAVEGRQLLEAGGQPVGNGEFTSFETQEEGSEETLESVEAPAAPHQDEAAEEAGRTEVESDDTDAESESIL